MNQRIPESAISRLCLMIRILEELDRGGIHTVYSQRIGELIGAPAHTVRKDINFLGEVGNTLAGYDVVKLKKHITSKLGIDRKHHACIVGLGKLGSAIMNDELYAADTFSIVAGFDSDINKIELINSKIDVFPAYRMEEIIAQKRIEYAILTVPKTAAEATAARLEQCGIRGIINFAPVVVKSRTPGVFVRNIDLITEMRILSAFLSQELGNAADGPS